MTNSVKKWYRKEVLDAKHKSEGLTELENIELNELILEGPNKVSGESGISLREILGERNNQQDAMFVGTIGDDNLRKQENLEQFLKKTTTQLVDDHKNCGNGTTLCSAIVTPPQKKGDPTTITTANLGDSRAALIIKYKEGDEVKYTSVSLTQDHDFESKRVYEHIESKGAKIKFEYGIPGSKDVHENDTTMINGVRHVVKGEEEMILTELGNFEYLKYGKLRVGGLALAATIGDRSAFQDTDPFLRDPDIWTHDLSKIYKAIGIDQKNVLEADLFNACDGVWDKIETEYQCISEENNSSKIEYIKSKDRHIAGLKKVFDDRKDNNTTFGCNTFSDYIVTMSNKRGSGDNISAIHVPLFSFKQNGKGEIEEDENKPNHVQVGNPQIITTVCDGHGGLKAISSKDSSVDKENRLKDYKDSFSPESSQLEQDGSLVSASVAAQLYAAAKVQPIKDVEIDAEHQEFLAQSIKMNNSKELRALKDVLNNSAAVIFYKIIFGDDKKENKDEQDEILKHLGKVKLESQKESGDILPFLSATKQDHTVISKLKEILTCKTDIFRGLREEVPQKLEKISNKVMQVIEEHQKEKAALGKAEFEREKLLKVCGNDDEKLKELEKLLDNRDPEENKKRAEKIINAFTKHDKFKEWIKNEGNFSAEDEIGQALNKIKPIQRIYKLAGKLRDNLDGTEVENFFTDNSDEERTKIKGDIDTREAMIEYLESHFEIKRVEISNDETRDFVKEVFGIESKDKSNSVVSAPLGEDETETKIETETISVPENITAEEDSESLKKVKGIFKENWDAGKSSFSEGDLNEVVKSQEAILSSDDIKAATTTINSSISAFEAAKTKLSTIEVLTNDRKEVISIDDASIELAAKGILSKAIKANVNKNKFDEIKTVTFVGVGKGDSSSKIGFGDRVVRKVFVGGEDKEGEESKKLKFEGKNFGNNSFANCTFKNCDFSNLKGKNIKFANCTFGEGCVFPEDSKDLESVSFSKCTVYDSVENASSAKDERSVEGGPIFFTTKEVQFKPKNHDPETDIKAISVFKLASDLEKGL